MIRERKSDSDILLEEMAGVVGETCDHSCDHHNYDVSNGTRRAVCQRAMDHAGATIIIDVHAYVLLQDDISIPVVFTEHCCTEGDAR